MLAYDLTLRCDEVATGIYVYIGLYSASKGCHMVLQRDLHNIIPLN